MIGLDVKAGKQLIFYGTSGEKQVAYFHNIKIEVGGWVNDCYAGFSYDLETLPYGLLGQEGFFNLYKVTFDYIKEEFELKQK